GLGVCDGVALLLKRGERPRCRARAARSRLPCLIRLQCGVDQPIRSNAEVDSILPFVGGAAGSHARRDGHVAALTANVDARADQGSAVTDLLGAPDPLPMQVPATAWSDDNASRRQRSVLRFKLRERLAPV